MQILDVLFSDLNFLARFLSSLLVFKQVTLVRKNENQDVITHILVDFLEPAINGQEGLPIGYVEDYYDAVSTLVVGVGDGTVTLLACSIPNLELGGGFVYLEGAEPLMNLIG